MPVARTIPDGRTIGPFRCLCRARRAGALVAPAALIALLPALGCATTINSSHVLHPEDVVTLRLEGARPRLDVANDGPGGVRILYGPPAASDAADLGPGGVIARTLLDPHVQIINISDHRTIIHLEARDAEGYSAEQSPPALHRDAPDGPDAPEG